VRLVRVVPLLFVMSCFSEGGGQDGNGDGSDASASGSSSAGTTSAGTTSASSTSATSATTSADGSSDAGGTAQTSATTGEMCPEGSIMAPPIVAGWDGPYVRLSSTRHRETPDGGVAAAA